MIIIGERINASRKGIKEAIINRDKKFIQQEAETQVKAGAQYVDVNCGFDPAGEADNMEWLVSTVQEAVKMPLCIDSPNPDVVKRGLKKHKGKALVNSISGESGKADSILPAVREFGAGVIALTLDDNGMPSTAEDRLKVAAEIIKKIDEYKIPHEDVYFDLLVRAVATEQKQGIEFLKSVAMIKSSLGIKTVCGLSNISFGLPGRSVLNASFMSMAISYGLDAAIIDPTINVMMSAVKAGEALTNKDECCMNYITAFREGKLKQ